MTAEVAAEPQHTKRTPRPRPQRPLAGREPLAEPEEVATYLGVPLKTLEHWRYKEIGPRFSRVGNHVRYRWPDVDAWLESNTVQTGTAA